MAYHTRSNSLPSSSHSLDLSIEDRLSRIQSSSSASSPVTICQNLFQVNDLYEQINDLIRLPLNQQVLCNESCHQGVNEILEGSLSLLDACDTTKDIVSQMKELILDLESSLRRRSGASNRLDAYKVSRKKIIKQVSKCIATLNKSMKMGLKKDSNLVSTVRMAKEVESICLSVLKSVLVFMSGSKARSDSHSWSLVTNMMKSNRETCDSRAETSEVEIIDQALYAKSDAKDVQNLQIKLESLESTIFEIENGLNSVSKCLVKIRVSFLNVLTH